jgi:hypothetical protein
MSVRPLRIFCPGATAAGVASTLLIGAGARFTAAPLGDGRWQVDAEVADATAALLALRIGEPLVVEAIEEEPPLAAEEVAPAPSAPLDLLDVTSFRAKTLASAKTTAVRTARGFGATAYGDGRWAAEENAFSRPAYRGKTTGAIVFGAHEDGRWWIGWRPAT